MKTSINKFRLRFAATVTFRLIAPSAQATNLSGDALYPSSVSVIANALRLRGLRL